MKAFRSKQFLEFILVSFIFCQRCHGSHNRALDTAHPPKRRPWNGGMGLKASDLGSLRLCRTCHDIEQAESHAWSVIGRERDFVSLRNLMAYAEYLDPGVDLLSELLEYAQPRIIELERGES